MVDNLQSPTGAIWITTGMILFGDGRQHFRTSIFPAGSQEVILGVGGKAEWWKAEFLQNWKSAGVVRSQHRLYLSKSMLKPTMAN